MTCTEYNLPSSAESRPPTMPLTVAESAWMLTHSSSAMVNGFGGGPPPVAGLFMASIFFATAKDIKKKPVSHISMNYTDCQVFSTKNLNAEIQNYLLFHGTLGRSGHDPYRTLGTGNGSHHWFFTSPTHLLSANVWGPVVCFTVSVLVANVNHYFFWHNSLSPGNIWGLHVSFLCYFQFQIQFGIFMATMLHAVFFFKYPAVCLFLPLLLTLLIFFSISLSSRRTWPTLQNQTLRKVIQI